MDGTAQLEQRWWDQAHAEALKAGQDNESACRIATMTVEKLKGKLSERFRPSKPKPGGNRKARRKASAEKRHERKGAAA